MQIEPDRQLRVAAILDMEGFSKVVAERLRPADTDGAFGYQLAIRGQWTVDEFVSGSAAGPDAYGASRQGRAVDSERHPPQEASVVKIKPWRRFGVAVDVAG